MFAGGSELLPSKNLASGHVQAWRAAGKSKKNGGLNGKIIFEMKENLQQAMFLCCFCAMHFSIKKKPSEVQEALQSLCTLGITSSKHTSWGYSVSRNTWTLVLRVATETEPVMKVESVDPQTSRNPQNRSLQKRGADEKSQNVCWYGGWCPTH